MKFKTKMEENVNESPNFSVSLWRNFTQHVAAIAVVAGCGSEYKK